MPNLFRHPTGQVAEFALRLLSMWGVETSSTRRKSFNSLASLFGHSLFYKIRFVIQNAVKNLLRFV